MDNYFLITQSDKGELRTGKCDKDGVLSDSTGWWKIQQNETVKNTFVVHSPTFIQNSWTSKNDYIFLDNIVGSEAKNTIHNNRFFPLTFETTNIGTTIVRDYYCCQTVIDEYNAITENLFYIKLSNLLLVSYDNTVSYSSNITHSMISLSNFKKSGELKIRISTSSFTGGTNYKVKISCYKDTVLQDEKIVGSLIENQDCLFTYTLSDPSEITEIILTLVKEFGEIQLNSIEVYTIIKNQKKDFSAKYLWSLDGDRK